MACPVCSHTMQNLGLNTAERRVWWCPRCGTVKTETDTFEEHTIPRWTRLLKAGETEELRREVPGSHPQG